MKTKTINGELIKTKLFSQIIADNKELKSSYNLQPGIAFVGFQNVPLGKYNVPFHIKTASELGFNVFRNILEENATEDLTIDVIQSLNQNEDVHCIEVLQPLPAHLNPLRIMNAVSPVKELEGFHPFNMMKVMFPDLHNEKFRMCLPAALDLLFSAYEISLNEGDNWVLLIDDEFLKNPLVNMVTRTAFEKSVPDNCSQTIVNIEDPNAKKYCRNADFLVVVTKKPLIVDADWIKKGVYIIDIYANLIKEVISKNNPSRLIPIIRGGVDAEAINGVAAGIVPIPGGLMGVVLAVLLQNTLNAFKNSISVEQVLKQQNIH